MIGDKIKFFRNKAGITQQQLAEKAKIDRSMISKLENNNAKPSLDTLCEIATALGIDITKLLDSA